MKQHRSGNPKNGWKSAGTGERSAVPERVETKMCMHIKSSDYKTINEVDQKCLRCRDWLDGKYFCFKADCDECPKKSEGTKTD